MMNWIELSWNGWTAKDIKFYFQLGPFSEILTIINLRHAASSIWTSAEPVFRLLCIKLYSIENHYTTMPHQMCDVGIPSTRISPGEKVFVSDYLQTLIWSEALEWFTLGWAILIVPIISVDDFHQILRAFHYTLVDLQNRVRIW